MFSWLFYNTLKRKVLVFVLIILTCFLSGFSYTFYATYKVNNQIEKMFQTSLELNEMKITLDAFEGHIEMYLGTKSSDSFVAYIDAQNLVKEYQSNFDYGANSNAVLLQLSNISKLLEEYLETAKEATDYKRARNTEKYLEKYGEMLTIRSYIDAKVEQILKWDYDMTLLSYMALAENIRTIQIGLVAMTLVLITLSVLFVFSFSTQVTKPIVELSSRAKAISEGNYDFSVNHVKGFKEAQVLERTFDMMTQNIKRYVEELKDKVLTENQLRLSETEKLKMKNLLNEAELMALQSQINPHFLFNTLNAGLQLAIIEDAERTSVFIENLSDLFRYNIQPLTNRVTLNDEIANVKNYAELMKVRYGDGISFEFDVDEPSLASRMSPLLLQPLVENSIIHGFSERLAHRIIKIKAYTDKNYTRIMVEDNGKGISESLLTLFNSGDFIAHSKPKSHTTGLGLSNVYERIRHMNGHMVFKSILNQMTLVEIAIPIGGHKNENFDN